FDGVRTAERADLGDRPLGLPNAPPLPEVVAQRSLGPLRTRRGPRPIGGLRQPVSESPHQSRCAADIEAGGSDADRALPVRHDELPLLIVPADPQEASVAAGVANVGAPLPQGC